jgi:hypothetical protein
MDRYLIFCTSRRLWWGPNRAGYVSNVANAGVYTLIDAKEICDSANGHLTPDQSPEEIPVPMELAQALYQNRRTS